MMRKRWTSCMAASESCICKEEPPQRKPQLISYKVLGSLVQALVDLQKQECLLDWQTFNYVSVITEIRLLLTGILSEVWSLEWGICWLVYRHGIVTNWLSEAEVSLTCCQKHGHCWFSEHVYWSKVISN